MYFTTGSNVNVYRRRFFLRGQEPPCPDVLKPVVRPIAKAFTTIMFTEILGQEANWLVVRVLDVPGPLVKEVRVDVRDLVEAVVNSTVIVSGILHITVRFVGDDGLVRELSAAEPFCFGIELPWSPGGFSPHASPAASPFNARNAVTVSVEDVITEFDPVSRRLTVKVLLKAGAVKTESRTVTILTDISGTGITEVRRIAIRAFVVHLGRVEEVQAITGVAGPAVVEVRRLTVRVDIVDDGIPDAVPVEVVEDVITG